MTREIVAAFLKLGFTSFGGPIAHIGYIRSEVVEKRKWIDDARYADLVALCQFLPGPASSQVVFALGMQRGGLAGAMLAALCFTLPSAALMIGFAYGAGSIAFGGWVAGLKLAAVAVVAQAVWTMGKKLCPDRARISIGIAAAASVLVLDNALAQIGAIAGGAAIGWWLYRERATPAAPAPIGRHRVFAAAALVLFFGVLVALPPLATATRSRTVEQFDSFYRAGALVFGGGHVVLPMLRSEVVPRGWIGDEQFLAGYGAAQAVPGPLFTFAGYLGTAMTPGANAWLGGLWCLFAILLPSWLLVGGALPFWARMRSATWAQAALAGANAAVVGVLLAALWDPVIVEGVHGARHVAAALVAFALLEAWKLPPWVVVAALAGFGQLTL